MGSVKQSANQVTGFNALTYHGEELGENWLWLGQGASVTIERSWPETYRSLGLGLLGIPVGGSGEGEEDGKEGNDKGGDPSPCLGPNGEWCGGEGDGGGEGGRGRLEGRCNQRKVRNGT